MLGIRRFHLAADDKCCGKDMEPCCIDVEYGDTVYHTGRIWSIEPCEDIFYTGFCCKLWCAIRWRIGWKKLMRKRKGDDSGI